MADAYWRNSDPRQPPPSSSISSLVGKRSRSDYDVASGHEISYYPRDVDRGTVTGIRDTDTLNASYDRYLRSAQIPSYSIGKSTTSMGGGLANHSLDNPRIVSVDRVTTVKDRSIGYAGGRPEVALPSDASNTLFVEGLPANCTRREVAHIFRPFVGYREVRLVSKGPRHHSGDPVVLCFIDFVSPAHAATAMAALQGYKFDELDRSSVNLRLQFARYPGARSGGGHRGKR